jgi:hypothetical protein
MQHNLSIILLFTYLIAQTFQNEDLSGQTLYSFPNYPYKRSSNFETKFKSHSNRCEFKTDCMNLRANSAKRQNCILKCVSEKCYNEIYMKDPLEEGEIDQRITSFKGCYSAYVNNYD